MSDPATAPFSINIEGVPKFLFSLNRFGAFMEYLTRNDWENVAGVFYDAEEEIFDAQGTPIAFKALSPKYAEWKDKNYPNMPIMQREGYLKAALTGRGAEPGKAVPIKKFTKQKGQGAGITVGVRSPYAYAHQKGLGPLPKREIIQVTAAERIKFAKVMQQALVRIERESFGGGSPL